MLLKIVQTGDEHLRTKAKKLSLAQIKNAETQKLIDLMIATLRDQPGVGLAAPQVGERLQIIVIEDKKQYHARLSPQVLAAQKRQPVALQVIINPVVTILDSSQNYFFEGCLSIAGFRAVVPRADKLKVSGLGRDGEPLTLVAEGWLARIVQHEVEHLGGRLSIDTMLSRSFSTEKQFMKDWVNATPAEIRKHFL